MYDTTELSEKVTPKLIPPQLWPHKFTKFESIWLQCEGILQEKVTKHASLIWSNRRRHNGCHNDTWSSWAHSILSHCFSASRSV